MIEKERFPQIRFKSFSEEWELCKLKDISERIIRKNINLESALPLTISAQYGLVDQTTFFNNQVAGQNISNYYLIRKGEFAYNKSTSQDYPAGAVKRLERYEMGVLSTLYILFRLQNTVSSDYLAAYFDSTCWHKEITARAAEGARNHGLLNISAENFFDIEIKKPGEIDEQIKIGGLLLNIDNIIVKKQIKYEKLINLKRSVLEKIFPEYDSDMPAIRFKSFQGIWKKHKIKEILVERNEQAPQSDEYPLMAFVANKGVTQKGERYDRSSLINDEKNKLYKKTKFGDFIYSSNNLESGSIGLNKYGNASISPVYSVFFPANFVNSDFIGHRLVRKDFINEMVKWRQGVVYGQWRIHESDFKKMDILLPPVDEQRKIGDFLKTLDKITVLYEKELEKLQNLKKALQEKLFL